MGFNFQALKESIQQSSKVVSSGGGDSTFFNITDDRWKTKSGKHECDIRLIAKEETNGFVFDVVHNYIGYPGKEQKSWPCQRNRDANATDVACTLYNIRRNPQLSGLAMDYPIREGNRTVIKNTPLADILKMLGPKTMMILTVAIPDMYNDPNAPADLSGVLVWYVRKPSLVSKIIQQFDNFSKYPTYFTDMNTGVMLKVTFDPNCKSPGDMYGISPFMPAAVPEEIYLSAPDTEQYRQKEVEDAVCRQKVEEMLTEAVEVDNLLALAPPEQTKQKLFVPAKKTISVPTAAKPLQAVNRIAVAPKQQAVAIKPRIVAPPQKSRLIVDEEDDD